MLPSSSIAEPESKEGGRCRESRLPTIALQLLLSLILALHHVYYYRHSLARAYKTLCLYWNPSHSILECRVPHANSSISNQPKRQPKHSVLMRRLSCGMDTFSKVWEQSSQCGNFHGYSSRIAALQSCDAFSEGSVLRETCSGSQEWFVKVNVEN